MSTFGERAKMTFVQPEEDVEAIKRFLAAAESSSQGKILFLTAPSGTGKSTFVHSLEIFFSDRVGEVVRLPPPHELAVSEIPGFLAKLPVHSKFTVVNFDGREAPYFNEPEYQTFLGALNGLLRSRRDLLVIWPVTDTTFSAKLIQLLERVGGKSAFGIAPQIQLNGISKERFVLVLEKLLQVANWRLEDAAIADTEVDALVDKAERIGVFLDDLQSLIATRFDVGEMGVEFPTVLIAISSGEPKIREITRSIRRADSYYIEASRLLMYTKQSNVAEWWGNRATSLRSALPHVIALFNAQLVSISASTVVHAVLQHGDPELRALVDGVRADRGNAKRVMESSELFKYLSGEALDNREYGSSVKDETSASFSRIQAQSERKHRALNDAVLQLAAVSGATLPELALEKSLVPGLQTDATFRAHGRPTVALEFHHKAASESTNNKLAIYVLEKLKEYTINYGLASR
jgi:energy-coupling factor transporter ATP-binding protein EcfA2